MPQVSHKLLCTWKPHVCGDRIASHTVCTVGVTQVLALVRGTIWVRSHREVIVHSSAKFAGLVWLKHFFLYRHIITEVIVHSLQVQCDRGISSAHNHREVIVYSLQVQCDRGISCTHNHREVIVHSLKVQCDRGISWVRDHREVIDLLGNCVTKIDWQIAWFGYNSIGVLNWVENIAIESQMDPRCWWEFNFAPQLSTPLFSDKNEYKMA